MIRPLRQRHRLIMATLAVALPMAFAAGLALRKNIPIDQNLPRALENLQPTGVELWAKADLWDKGIKLTRLLADSSDSEKRMIELTPAPGTIEPDVLVYWSPGDAQNRETLADDCILLGRCLWSSRTILPLPISTRDRGRLILYSLANQTIVQTSKAMSLNNAEQRNR